MDNAIISISGTNSNPFEDDETVELITSGRYYKEEGRYVVSYNESELTGMNGTTTFFHIEPDRVTLLRSGEVSAHMIFERGRKHISLMETPFGSLTVGISTWKIDSRLNDDGGDITVEYAVEVDHEITGANSIHVCIKGVVS